MIGCILLVEFVLLTVRAKLLSSNQWISNKFFVSKNSNICCLISMQLNLILGTSSGQAKVCSELTWNIDYLQATIVRELV